MRRSPGPAARTYIQPVSTRRRARDAGYPNARKAVYARADGRCEVAGCAAPVTDVHHLAGRGGPDPHRLDNLLGCCRAHHGLIHANPAWAYAMGYLVRRHGAGGVRGLEAAGEDVSNPPTSSEIGGAA